MAFDEETKTMTLDPNQIEVAKNELAMLVLEFVPEDLTDGKPDANGNPTKPQKGMTLEWLISVGINDPLMKQKFYNEAIVTVAPGDHSTESPLLDSRVIKNDLERYWHSHDYSDQKDIFSIKSFADLAVAADRAKNKYDAAQADKEYLDADNPGAVEVFRDDNKWRIYALHNKGAACKFGKGTEWCTAAPGQNYFEEYYEPDDPLFYFEDKENLGGFNGRWQIHFGSEQFMDERDREIDDEDRDELIGMLGETDAAKKYQIVRYWVERGEWMQIVYDENTTERELMVMAKRFAGEGEREVIEAITENPNVTVEILKFIAANDENGMSMAIGHKKFPFEAIEELANSEDKETRYNAVTTGRLSAKTLTRLSEDEYWRVRGSVAKSQKTPPEVLAKLATDEKYEGVVDALLRNRSLPSELFEPILKRAEEEDAKGAVMPYKTKPADGGEWRAPPAYLYSNAQGAAASNPQAPEELLRDIVANSLNDSEGRGWHVRSEVARNPSTPLDLLQALAKDEAAHVRNPAKRALDVRGEGLESLAENWKRFLK